MGLVPYERWVLATPLLREEIQERLRQLLAQQQRAEIAFEGDVFEQGFELCRVIPYAPAFSLRYRGRFRDREEGGTRILFAIRLPDRTLRWLIAIFSVLGSFALLLFLQFFAPFLPPIGNVIAAIVIFGSIMAYAIIWGLFKAEAEKGKEILFNVLDVEQVRKPEYHFGRM